MTDRLTLGTIISLLLVITSCDCVVDHQGYVQDAQTGKPIIDATIRFDRKEYKTDSLGYFKIHYITGFCPDRDFEIEKENYKTQKIKIEFKDDEIIYRVQSNNDNRGSVEENSLNFEIKDDTIHFYLTDKRMN